MCLQLVGSRYIVLFYMKQIDMVVSTLCVGVYVCKRVIQSFGRGQK